MRTLDRVLSRWRIGKAAAWVRPGDRLLDVGSHDGSLMREVRLRVASAVGIDAMAEPRDDGPAERIVRGAFPDDLDAAPGSFDCITALAVLEHVQDPSAFAAACFRLLSPAGRVVLTVPHPAVDRIVEGLIALRLADGMDFEEHHGFEVNRTIRLFEQAGFQTVARRPFQLGLNHLFVFAKPVPEPNLGMRVPRLPEGSPILRSGDRS